MAEFKVVISTKDGKSYQREAKDAEANVFINKKLGENVKGDSFGLSGYEMEITGGSDYCGFPMRKDIPGTVRKRILAVIGTGVKKKAKGIRQRKTVCGNTIHAKIAQINLKVLKEGKDKLGAEAAPAEEAKEEKPKAEKPKEEKKEE